MRTYIIFNFQRHILAHSFVIYLAKNSKKHANINWCLHLKFLMFNVRKLQWDTARWQFWLTSLSTVYTKWAVLCSSNRHLCLTDNHADATKLKVFPKNPRIPNSHALELHCASQCDSHLKHSLKLSWSKDGEPFEINGTEDGRSLWVWGQSNLQS